MKPRWPPVTDLHDYGNIEDCEQSSGPPASKHTLPSSLALQVQDKTRQGRQDKAFIIIILQAQFFGTQLAIKRSSRRAKLILLQIRYYILISKKAKKKKRRNMCNEFKSKKDKSV